MRKMLYSLLMLLMGVTTVAYAQQEESTTLTTWDGNNLEVTLNLGQKKTYEYTATANGTLYIYSDDQNVNDNLPLNIWGGSYLDGAYTADTLQEAGAYENGVGIYGWISVKSGDIVRFTIIAASEAGGTRTSFTLKSLFFTDTTGCSWESPIALNQNSKATLPVYANEDKDYLADLSHATFCRFVAPSDGVASIFTDENLIYYVEEDLYGNTDESMKYVSQDTETNDHEFVVKKDKAYIVIVPNNRPTEVTFKMTQNRLGLSEKFPIVIDQLPATINLREGDNYYKFSHELISGNTIMEVAVATGWNGTITYMEGTDWGATESKELSANTVTGSAATFIKNVDTRFLNGDAIVVNFNMTDKTSMADAATLTLRAPTDGESFETATAVTLEGKVFNGAAARDYWFAYTAEADAEISFTTNATIKHVNFTAGLEQLVPTNAYRVDKGETIYICVSTTTTGNYTLGIKSKEILAGDYCDNPIYFALGEDITIEGRGVNNYHSFTAAENGFAIFTSTNWTVHFREECDGAHLNPIQTTTEKSSTTIYTYRLPIAAGKSYIVEVEIVDEDITITTSFEAAATGDVCATAIEIETLGDTIKYDYEFNVEKWYKFTAEQTGFYTIAAKLGYGGNMKTKVGDCDAKETNANPDNSKDNAYMGGYKSAKVYVEGGQTLYIYTKTGSVNDSEQFGNNFYLVASYAGAARPGEVAAIAVKAKANTEYTVLQNDENGYDQWYTYTIPANEVATIELYYTTKTKYLTNNISLYKEDMTTSMSQQKGDFAQTNLTNDTGETYGKRMEIPAADEARAIYIKVGTANAKFYPDPVVWKIECNERNPEDVIIPVTNITLDYEKHTLTEGQMFYLKATVNPSDATDKTIAWSSSDTDVATVDEGGKVTAITAGTTTITAKAGDKEATCTITVERKVIPVSSITLNQATATLPEGSTITLSATVNPTDATDRTVAWSSSNTDVATVDEGGKVTAITAGTATITAKAGDKEATCTVTVERKVIPVGSIRLNQASAALVEGQTLLLIATVNPTNATDKTVTWSSNNTDVATVDDSGLVTTITPGTATITATAGDKKDTCVITVEKKPAIVNGITLSQTSATLSVGKTLTLTVTIDIDNDDATEKTVTWSSSDTLIATVDKHGMVTAMAEGKATITAAVEGKEATCAITVERKVIPVDGITLNQTSATLEEGSILSLNATVEPIDATDKTVTWSSSDTDIATVDENGFVTAVAEGTATITAKAGDKEATCMVTVTRKVIPVDEVTLNLNADTLVVGKSLTLIVTIVPENATDKAVTWSCSNDSVVTVDNSGKITAVAVGTADITATVGDKSATCTIVVIAKEEDTEGIEFEEADDKTPAIYDLMGRKVLSPTKGIYIINGVKRIIK